MDAVITAGGIPAPEEGLFPYTNGASKALLDIAGKPMVQWVIDALDSAQTVENLIVVGLDHSSGLTANKPLHYLPNQGGMVANIKAGVGKVAQLNPQAERLLLVSSDIPAITPEIVDWVVHTAQETDHDLVYNVVARPVVEARFPQITRTYLKLKDIEVCGGDITVIKASLVTSHQDLWRRLTASRKNPLKQAALIGWDTLLLILLRRLDLDAAARQASKNLGIRARAVLSPYAEVAMDVDKPYQLERLIEDLQ